MMPPAQLLRQLRSLSHYDRQSYCLLVITPIFLSITACKTRCGLLRIKKSFNPVVITNTGLKDYKAFMS